MKKILILSLLALCACTKAPDPVLPVATDDQIAWHNMEMYAFVHFGLNTFSDLEWGYGNVSPEVFDPKKLDCEQWVKLFKEIGMKGVIITAKHHDGFCLWPTETTDYSIKASPWKNGEGDLVGELCEACRKYGLKFGLYLSPWDRNNINYGNPEYVEIYHNQISELVNRYSPLFEFWFDGANGGDGWYGGLEGRRKIDAKTYYNYAKARDIIWNVNPSAMIFGGRCPTIRWVGNERGWSGATQWANYNVNRTDRRDSQFGVEDETEYLPAEVDVSIRPGWFYTAKEDSLVKSPEKLTQIYYESVGHNCNLILNFPIDRNGLVNPRDSANAMAWASIIKADLSDNILEGAKASSSVDRGFGFKASKAIDSKYDTYWSMPDGTVSGEIRFDFPSIQAVNRVLLQEYVLLGQRVRNFTVEAMASDGNWAPVETADSTTTIGFRRIVRFKTVETKALKVVINDARGPVCLSNVEAFCSPTSFAEDTEETGTTLLKSLSKDDPVYELSFDEPKSVSGFRYVPFVGTNNHITHYDFYVDGVKVSEGEFSNIENNPIPQNVDFASVSGKVFRFVATGLVPGATSADISAFELK